MTNVLLLVMEVVPSAPDPSTSGPVKSILRCLRGHPSFSSAQHVRDWWRGHPSCNTLTNVARTTWLAELHARQVELLA